MATLPTIDLDTWLLPVSDENPAGRYLAYEAEYDAIREARRSEDVVNQGEWKRETKVADWSKVVDLGGRCLRTQTKDLQIAAWVTEALAQLHGFAGLRDGFLLLHGIQERFWESYYPQVEDGDLESRYGPFVFLNDPRLLPLLIRRVPITRGLGEEAYSYARYQESRETDNVLKKSPEKEKVLRAEGRITGKMFDDQVKQTPRQFYEGLVEDLEQAGEALLAFAQSTDERFGREAPSLLNVAKALEDCQRLLGPILAVKRQEEPDPEPPPVALAVEFGAGAGADLEPGAGGNGVAAVSAPRAGGSAGADLGRVLIEFRGLAERLAETGTKLEANRKRYLELQEELKALDAEYEALSRIVGRDGQAHELLLRVLQLQGRA